MRINCKFLIVGAGIMGLTIARELIHRGYSDIIIIEKEKNVGKHASGRSSGVLHAGIYYSTDSLKAKFCLEGNNLMTQYCIENGLEIINCGKVIVATNENEIDGIYELEKRARSSGAKVEIINEAQLAIIESKAKTTKIALYSPNTSVVNSRQIMSCLVQELLSSNKVKIIYNCRFKRTASDSEIYTSLGKIKFDFLINAAGAFADKLAHSFGVATNLILLPFKGTYLKLSKSKSDIVKGNVYPVPDLRNPFLGVHLTRSINGTVYVGPTAIPAFGRENYGLLDDLSFESLVFAVYNAKMFVTNDSYKSAAVSEPKKYFKRFVFEEVNKMVKGLTLEDLKPCEKVGIRPQLIDIEKMELVMDFKLIREANSLHILNAISPAWTSSMSFSQHVIENYII